jgi:hypothetical protein
MFKWQSKRRKAENTNHHYRFGPGVVLMTDNSYFQKIILHVLKTYLWTYLSGKEYTCFIKVTRCAIENNPKSAVGAAFW